MPRWLSALALSLIVVGQTAGEVRANTPADALAIGEASLVVPDVSGRIGEVTRTISVDDDVFADEVINTAASGATRIIFEDDTELTVGANSTVVLDRFVYDPNAGTGALVVNLLNGVFDFTSGDLPSDAYELNTPSATLAIRGTGVRAIIEDGDSPGYYDLTVFVTTGIVAIIYVDADGIQQVIILNEGEGARIENLPRPELATLQGSTLEIAVETCSDAVECSGGSFEIANQIFIRDLTTLVAFVDVEPDAGDESSTSPNQNFIDLGSGGGGGGGDFRIDGVSDF